MYTAVSAKKTLLLIVVCILTIFLPWIGLFALIFYIERFISSRLSSGFILSLFLSTASVIAMTGALSFVIDFIFPTEKQYIPMTIVLILVLLYLHFFQNYTTLKLRIKKNEFTAFVVAICAAIFLLIPAIKLHSASNLVQFLSSGEDNASHFSMLNRDIIQQSPPYFDKQDTGLIQTLNIYPQGIQSFFGYLFWLVFGTHDVSLLNLLRYYYLMVVLIASSLVFMVAIIIQKHTEKRFSLASSVIGSIAVFIGAILYMLGWGFVTQIASLVFLACLYYLMVFESTSKNIPKSSLLYICGSMVIGITFSWYLLLPIVAAVVFPYFYKEWRNFNMKEILILSGMTLLSILPIILNVTSGKGAGAINEAGGIWKFLLIGQSTIIIGLILFILLYFRKKISNVATLFIGSSFALTALVGSYQLLTIHLLEYYFYKTLYLLLIISVILITTVSFNLMSKYQKIRSSYISITVLFVFTAVLLIVNPVYPRVYINNWFNHTLSPTTMDFAVGEYKKSKQYSIDVIYINQCPDNTQEYIANRWTGAIYMKENANRSQLETTRFYGDNSAKRLGEYLHTHPETIITRTPCQ